MADSLLLVDADVLLSATAPARPLHRAALEVLNRWPNQGLRLCASGQIFREYLAVATRPPALNGLGLNASEALENVAAFSGRMRLLEEDQRVFDRLRELVRRVACSGKQIHDANLVATALAHQVPKLVTANIDDFRRFEPYIELVELAGS